VTVERPSAFFGFLIAEKLAEKGIKVEGQLLGQGTAGGQTRELAVYETALAEVLARCNKDSFALAAESLLKTVAARKAGQGSWEKGREIISEYLEKELGVHPDEFYIDDGCGLSRNDKLSPNVIVRVLGDIYGTDSWEMYRESLAAGGIDGTIGKYFKDKKYKGRVFGKTGYINGVKSLSGLCRTDKGDIIFSVLTNKANGETRPAINDVAEAIMDEFAMNAE